MAWHTFYHQGYEREINENGEIYSVKYYTDGRVKRVFSKLTHRNPLNHVEDLENEIWYCYWKENQYEHYVSTMGRQKSRRYLFETPVYTEHLLRQRLDKDGYVFIASFNKSKKFGHVHRLMAKCFLPDFEEHLTVNHKNLIKNDNRLENLEMMTLSDNIHHCWDTKAEQGWISCKEQKESASKARRLKKQREKYILATKIRDDRINERLSYAQIAEKRGINDERYAWAILNKYFPDTPSFRAEYRKRSKKK